MNRRFSDVWRRIRYAAVAFQEAFVSADVLQPEEFESFNARTVRYSLLWAWYENTAYRNMHSWAPAYKTNYSLYKYIRNIYNPAYRLTEFWRMILWGGLLDKDARDVGAVPIRTNNESLRPAIATLWRDSNFSREKEIYTMLGPCLGDVGIKIIDDPLIGEVRIEPVHPATIRDVEVDSKGRVTWYLIQDTRINPDTGRDSAYTEEAEFVGNGVEFRTYSDGSLYEWNGVSAEWFEPYPAVPLALIQHNDVGLDWGWSEMHTARSKVSEIDDLASKVHDYIRKMADPVWLFNFRKPKKTVDLTEAGAPSTVERPDPGREELPAIYASDARAQAQPLVTDQFNVDHAGTRIDAIMKELERDYPELQMDIWNAGGYTTGKALSTARQRVERKVVQRRPAYDEALVWSQSLAIAIGGFRGYDGYKGFGLEHFGSTKLEHSIPSDRSIFAIDALQDFTTKKQFWDIIFEAKKNKVPLQFVLEDLGWTKAKITEFLSTLPPEADNQPEDEVPPKSDEAVTAEEGERDVQVTE